jgi:hypothetical protein
MLELTLTTLLNTMSVEFCTIMDKEKDYLKSTLIAFSKAQDKYGSENVRKVISEANHVQLKTLAVTSVATKCPDKL